MAKNKEPEHYSKDPVHSVRSILFAHVPQLVAEYPSPLTKSLRDRLLTDSAHRQDLPNDMLILEEYLFILRVINLYGYHIEMPNMLDRVLSLSANISSIDLSDPDVQAFIRGSSEDPA